MNSGTPFVRLVACSGICLSALQAAGFGANSSAQRDLTLIANPASPEKLFADEQADLLERLAVVGTRIQTESNDKRREELRRERESILAREKAVSHSLAQARTSMVRLNVRTLKAVQSALLSKLAILDARISAEGDE